MAGRIRTMKPEILDDEKTAGLTDAEYRMFSSIILLSDDHGSFRANPKWLASQIWWAQKPSRDPRECLCTLSRLGLVTLYKNGGQIYGLVTNWTKHQRVDHPSKPRLPQIKDADSSEFSLYDVCACRMDSRDLRECLDNPRETLAPDLRPPTSDPDHRPPTIIVDLESTGEAAPIHPEPKPEPGTKEVVTSGETLVLIEVPPTEVSPAEQVFEHWREQLSPRSKKILESNLDEDKRIKRIKSRFKEGFSIEELCRAIDGVQHDEFLMGTDKDSKKGGYKGIATVLRDADQVDRLCRLMDDHEDGEAMRMPQRDPKIQAEMDQDVLDGAVYTDPPPGFFENAFKIIGSGGIR